MGPFGILMFSPGVMSVVDARDFELAVAVVTSLSIVRLGYRTSAYVAISKAKCEALGMPGVPRLHQLLGGWTADCGLVVDHINGDPLNNCRWNLRLATVSENARNRARTASALVEGQWPLELTARICVGVHLVNPAPIGWIAAPDPRPVGPPWWRAKVRQELAIFFGERDAA
jgi:hypothetical protein